MISGKKTLTLLCQIYSGHCRADFIRISWGLWRIWQKHGFCNTYSDEVSVLN